LPGPRRRVDAGGLASAMSEDLPSGGFARRGYAARIDGDHDALRTVIVGGVAYQFGVGDGRAVHGDLVGAGIEQALYIGYLAHASAHGQGDKDLAGHRLDDGQDQVALVAGGGDVQEGELVGALFVVALRDRDRIAGIDQIDEIDAFDYASRRDIQAGNDAARKLGIGQGGVLRHVVPSSSAMSCAAAKSRLPSYRLRPRMAP